MCCRIAALDKLIAEDDRVAQEREAARLLQSAARRSQYEALDALFGAPKQTPSKNREKDGALALGGCCLTMTHNNQLGVGGRGGRDVGEEARGS